MFYTSILNNQLKIEWVCCRYLKWILNIKICVCIFFSGLEIISKLYSSNLCLYVAKREPRSFMLNTPVSDFASETNLSFLPSRIGLNSFVSYKAANNFFSIVEYRFLRLFNAKKAYAIGKFFPMIIRNSTIPIAKLLATAIIINSFWKSRYWGIKDPFKELNAWRQ